MKITLLLYAVFAAMIMVSTSVQAQKFWLTTYEFPGGPKTGIASVGDSSLFVITEKGVLRSRNLERSWDTVLTTIGVSSISAHSGGKLLAGGVGKIYYTADTGKLWDSVVLNSEFPVSQFLETPEGDLFAITGTLDIQSGFVGAGVYYSPDGGKQWMQRNTGLGIYLSCQHIARDKNGRLYLACADEFVSGNGGLFISDDNGLNWKHIDIYVDGKGAIENKMNLESVTSLEVTPQDSLIISFSGVSRDGGSGVAVNLNLVKSIGDVESNSFWLARKIGNTSTWWIDRKLNNIHFARNGDWYSSASGSINTGGTYFSQTDGVMWEMNDFGLGLDVFGGRGIQYFSELPNGKIFMVQLLDERVYWADTSMTSSVRSPKQVEPDLQIFPNPVKKGERLSIHSDREVSPISILDILGKEIGRTVIIEGEAEITAPGSKGVYFIRSGTASKSFIVN